MSRKFTVMIFLILIGISLLMGDGNDSDLEEKAKAIFGSANNNSPGMVHFLLSDEEILIHYHVLPDKEIYVNEVIGNELTQKIRAYYKNIQTADKITFLILLPYQDALGKRGWKPYLYFTTTRKLFDQIDWSRFQDKELLEIAEDIQYIR